METEKDKKLRKDRNDFFLKVKSWLEPLDFTEIFHNHPCDKHPRIDMNGKGNGARVCCIHDSFDDHFYITSDIVTKGSREMLSIRTGQCSVGDTKKLNELIELINKNKKKLRQMNKIYSWFSFLKFKKKGGKHG